MIKSITTTNYLGESIKLDLTRPEQSGFIVKKVDGLGPVKANINVVEISTNDGGIFNSARRGIRNPVLYLQFLDNEKESIEDIRHKSYRYWPETKQVELTMETDNRISKTVGYVEHNDPAIFDKAEGCIISIICPYPHLYSAGENGKRTTIFYGVEPMFEFPFSNESLGENLLEMGEIQNQTEKVIVYDGDSEIGVTITIHAIGEASNITIYNTGTREIMSINTDKIAAYTGSGIIAGDDIVISTVKGAKSITLIRAGKSTNILNCLDKNPNWFSLTKGDNIFAYTAESGESNLQFKIENEIIYEGV